MEDHNETNFEKQVILLCKLTSFSLLLTSLLKLPFPRLSPPFCPLLPFHNCRDIASCSLHLHRLTCSENIDRDICRGKTWASACKSWKFTWQFTWPFTLTGITSMKAKSIYSGRPPNCHTRVVVTCSI